MVVFFFQPSELLREFDERNKIILFPQSFDDYQSKDGKISLFDFIERVEDALPAHLHGLAKVAEKFLEADKNGTYIFSGAISPRKMLYYIKIAFSSLLLVKSLDTDILYTERNN